MTRISIIVPVYNVEESYFRRCIASVLMQEYKDIEIIIIDDGSNSITAALCDEIAVSDNRIKVFHKSNEGVSIARNFGTKKSTGDYVMYMDSDDILAPDTITSGINAAKRDNLELVIGAVKKIQPEQSFNPINCTDYEIDIYDEVQLSKDLLREYFLLLDKPRYRKINGDSYIGRGPCARLIKREIADSCNFPEGLKLGEDVIWNMKLIERAERIGVILQEWYGYVIYETSSARKYYGNRREILEQYFDMLWKINPKYFELHRSSFAKNMAMEFNGWIRQEMLSDNNKHTMSEKKQEVKSTLRRYPWKMMMEKDIFSKLPLQYKMLLLSSSIGIWREFAFIENAYLKLNNR